VSEWLSIAIEGSTVRRGLKFAVVVGAVLIGINHGDALLAGDIDPRRIAKMALTVVVPYLVSTFSTVGARLQMKRHMPDPASRVE
jgi:hypothetical protein